MPEKPMDEYEFYKDIIARKKNSGCAACRQEGYMLEAQVMDMMRVRMERDGVANPTSSSGSMAENSDQRRAEERDTSIVDPVLQRHKPDQ